MNISIGILLAPYRIDFYNYLHDVLDFEIYFQTRTFRGQLYSTDDIEQQCNFIPKYLRSFWLNGRIISRGLVKLIKEKDPQFIIVPEFSIATIQLILIKKLLGRRYQLISLCDDSYAMIKEGGFSKVHTYSRKLSLPFINNILLTDLRAVNWYQQKYNKGIWLPLVQDERRIIQKENVIKEKADNYILNWHLQDTKIILFVGRLIEVKNLPVLFQACSMLTSPYRLIIIGDGEYREVWMKMCKDMNLNVDFIGKKNGEDLFAWYCVADIFVLPSRLEAFGAVANEALLFGCNCCISERAGSACLIRKGVNGYTFNPYSPNDLYEKLMLVWKMPRRSASKMEHSFYEYMHDAFKFVLS